jgi:uncharacterized protein (TIGR00251 family)
MRRDVYGRRSLSDSMSDSAGNLQAHAVELRRKLTREGGLVLDVKAVPRARTAEVSDVMANGALRVKVRAAPEKGRANEEICAVLADYLGVAKRSVEVIHGHASPQKRVRITP